jgi:hypothetical protein
MTTLDTLMLAALIVGLLILLWAATPGQHRINLVALRLVAQHPYLLPTLLTDTAPVRVPFEPIRLFTKRLPNVFGDECPQ